MGPVTSYPILPLYSIVSTFIHFHVLNCIDFNPFSSTFRFNSFFPFFYPLHIRSTTIRQLLVIPFTKCIRRYSHLILQQHENQEVMMNENPLSGGQPRLLTLALPNYLPIPAIISFTFQKIFV